MDSDIPFVEFYLVFFEIFSQLRRAFNLINSLTYQITQKWLDEELNLALVFLERLTVSCIKNELIVFFGV